MRGRLFHMCVQVLLLSWVFCACKSHVLGERAPQEEHVRQNSFGHSSGHSSGNSSGNSRGQGVDEKASYAIRVVPLPQRQKILSLAELQALGSWRYPPPQQEGEPQDRLSYAHYQVLHRIRGENYLNMANAELTDVEMMRQVHDYVERMVDSNAGGPQGLVEHLFYSLLAFDASTPESIHGLYQYKTVAEIADFQSYVRAGLECAVRGCLPGSPGAQRFINARAQSFQFGCELLMQNATCTQEDNGKWRLKY